MSWRLLCRWEAAMLQFQPAAHCMGITGKAGGCCALGQHIHCACRSCDRAVVQVEVLLYLAIICLVCALVKECCGQAAVEANG